MSDPLTLSAIGLAAGGGFLGAAQQTASANAQVAATQASEAIAAQNSANSVRNAVQSFGQQ